MTTEPTWYDTTATDTNNDDLFAPHDDAQMPVLHKSQAPVSSEDIALLQAAQYAGERDIGAMLKQAKQIGQLLGDKAFYSWGGRHSRVEGPTINLAYALAQVWGRCRTSVLLVEEHGSRVKLRGRYVDLLTVAVTERDYLAHLSDPPGKFADKPDQAERWRVMQLQSAASKAVRGAILGGLPTWLVDAAMDAAKATANRSATGGRPLPEARQSAIRALADKGLTVDELVAFVGSPVDLWTAAELGDLRQLYKLLDTGEASIEGIRAEMAGQAPQSKAPPKQQANRMASLGLSPLGSAEVKGKGKVKPQPKPEDPQVQAIKALESEVGDAIVRQARNTVGLSPKTPINRLGEKRRDEYAAKLRELYQPHAEDPAATFSGPASTSTLDAVLDLEIECQSGAIKRIRQDLKLDPKAAASTFDEDQLKRYQTELQADLDAKAEADDLSSLPSRLRTTGQSAR
jgi:hypothetical protein